MDTGMLVQLKDFGAGAVLAFAAMGSALGTGYAGMAAIGAWKKAFWSTRKTSQIHRV